MFHYFSKTPGREIEEVYGHSVLNSLALNLVFIFEPIYLYTLGYSLVQIMWFYVYVYAAYLLIISFGAKFASRFGYKHSIFVSNVFYIAYWVLLFSISNNPALFYIAPVFFALQKSFFWPAFDADTALGSAKAQRGRETSVLFSLMQIGVFVGPLLGGFVSEQFGFLVLFITASILMLFSAYPLFLSPDIYSKHEFTLKALWQVFRKYPRNFFAYWGYAEDLMLMSLWPIYMFMIIPDYFNLGLVSTIAAVIGTMLMLYIGRLADHGKKHDLLLNSSIFYGSTWIFRWLAVDLPGVLTFDALTKAGKDFLNVPLVSLTYERAAERDSASSADGHDFAIAYSVMYEMGVITTKILTALAAILILTYTGNIFLVFALAGVMTMLYGLLK